MRFEQFEIPTDPVGSNVLIRTERSIISAGTELANYTGLDPDTRRPGTWCAYPWNPGYGGIGRIIAAGPDAAGYQPGDRVYGRLHHANYEMVDTSNQYCVRVSETLDSTTASFVRMGNVAIS